MAIPLKDPDLVSFGTNFSTRITASPSTWNLLAADATQYSTLLAGYVAAYTAMSTGRDAGNRSQSLTSAKNATKASFLAFARALYFRVQADNTVSDADKNLLGIVVRAMPTPIGRPTVAPAMDIVKVTGRIVSIRVHDAAGDGKRTKPFGVKGVAICSFVGPSAPTDPLAYRWEGNTNESQFDIPFPDTVAPGAVVWVTSMWLNNRQETGPACSPISATIQYGVSLAA